MISMSNVSKWYGDFQVLAGCTTEVRKGEVVVVCGPSGSGKSTLIKTVNGLEAFQKGEIRIDGTSVGDRKTNLSKMRAKVGMVFHDLPVSLPQEERCSEGIKCSFTCGLFDRTSQGNRETSGLRFVSLRQSGIALDRARGNGRQRGAEVRSVGNPLSRDGDRL